METFLETEITNVNTYLDAKKPTTAADKEELPLSLD